MEMSCQNNKPAYGDYDVHQHGIAHLETVGMELRPARTSCEAHRLCLTGAGVDVSIIMTQAQLDTLSALLSAYHQDQYGEPEYLGPVDDDMIRVRE